ncbi:glycosyltransferase family 2 protein [Myroides injenensis]|uniref:glycosyltransferase family 2 protein n=1 Tax=Myroides injenensis TaxID=1183151 RepID=UPI000288996B|nr:glycosyltransferase family 2 protein [Myroides injenensis]
MPLISIILPAYNAASTISKCVNSILNQSFTDFELIIINDGSADETKEECDRLSKLDNRITFICQVNKGVSSARNRGINIAKGQYFVFVDSDDYVSPNYLFSLLEDYKTSKADLVIHTFHVVNFKEDWAPKLPNVLCSSTSFDVLFKNCELYKTGFLFGKLFKASIVKDYNIKFNESIILYEDSAFLCQYLKHCDTIFFNNIKEYFYNYYPDSLSRQKHCFKSVYAVYLIHLDYFLFCKSKAKTKEDFENLKSFKNHTNGLLRTSLATFYKLNTCKKERQSFLLGIPKQGIQLFKDYHCGSMVKNKILALLKNEKYSSFDFFMRLLYIQGMFAEK